MSYDPGRATLRAADQVERTRRLETKSIRPDTSRSAEAGSGTAVTPLRPSGTILVAGRRVDAITGGEFVEKGTPVRIVRIEGSGVVVHQEPRPDSPFVPAATA